MMNCAPKLKEPNKLKQFRRNSILFHVRLYKKSCRNISPSVKTASNNDPPGVLLGSFTSLSDLLGSLIHLKVRKQLRTFLYP